MDSPMPDEFNKSELLELLRQDGQGNISRANGIPRLIEALEGEASAVPCPLEDRRRSMEKHIERNWRRIRTQLPRCNGKCTKFGCPDAIVIGCWLRFKDEII
jgi:hypothetical protein